MELAEVLSAHTAAASQLRSTFTPGLEPWRTEGAGRFALETRPDVAWLDKHLPTLAAALLPAGYEFRLTVQVQRWKAALSDLRADSGTPTFNRAIAKRDQTEPTVDYLALRDAVTNPPLAWDGLTAVLGQVAKEREARLALTLVITLDTAEIAREVATETGTGASVAVWVFPEKLAAVLDAEPLDRLVEYVDPDRRTVFFVAAMAGVLTGDHLAVLGASPLSSTDPAQHLATLEAELEKASPLTSPAESGLSPADGVRAFRTAQKSVWQPYTSAHTPEMLTIAGETDHTEVAAALLRLRSILALAYVANSVTFDARYPTLSFEGEEGRRELVLTKEEIPADPAPHEAAYSLYRFAYEAPSGVPIEIVRRLTARMADDPALLFTRLNGILAASEDVHAGYLGEEVTKYFATLERAEDYLLRATRETEAAAVELTRDAGERLFKALGIVVATVIAAAFEPEIQNVAGIVASLTIGIYVALTVRYYAITLRDSAINLQERHAANLETFKKVLPKTVAGLLQHQQVDKAWDRYRSERHLAVRWLALLLALAVLAFIVFALRTLV